MCASRLATAGIAASLVGLLYAYERLTIAFPDVPDLYAVGGLTVAFALAVVLWLGVDALRWRRTLRPLGLEYVGFSSGEDSYVSELETYRGRFGGRPVTVACREGAVGSRRTRTDVETPVRASVGPTIRVRRSGLGGKPDDALPERVSVPRVERFDVHSPDAELARDLLGRPAVREALSGAEAVDELLVTEGFARTRSRGRVFDADEIRRQVDLVCETAAALEDAAA